MPRFLSGWCADCRCGRCTGTVRVTVTDGTPESARIYACGCPCHIPDDDGDPGQRTNPFTGRAWDED